MLLRHALYYFYQDIESVNIMITAQKMHKVTDVYFILSHIDDKKSLEKAGFDTLAEFNDVWESMKNMGKIKNAESETIMKSTADFFKNHGFAVREKGIGYCISFE